MHQKRITNIDIFVFLTYQKTFRRLLKCGALSEPFYDEDDKVEIFRFIRLEHIQKVGAPSSAWLAQCLHDGKRSVPRTTN